MSAVSRRVRVFVLLNVFDPDRAGGAAVYTDLCDSLSQRGFDVSVAAPYPFFPEWKDKSGRNGLRMWRYRRGEVDVARYGLFIPRNPNSVVQRMLFEGTFFLSALRALPTARKADVIMAFSPLTGGVAAAAVMKALTRKPLWLNVQDIAADAAAAAGIGGGFVARAFHAVEKLLFNQAEVWSTISPVMARRLAEFRKSDQPVLNLPNWVGLSLQREIESQPSKAGRAPSNPVRLLYAGNIGKKQDLVDFCKALHRSTLSFEMRIHGDGACAQDVAKWVAESGDSRFSYGNLLDEPGFARALSWTDYYVITETSGAGGSFIPSKLLPGVMSGTPLLTVSDAASPLGQELAESQAGPWLPWNRLAELPAILAAASREPARFAQWQQNAARRAEVFDREELIERFALGLRGLALRNEAPQNEAVARDIRPSAG